MIRQYSLMVDFTYTTVVLVAITLHFIKHIFSNSLSNVLCHRIIQRFKIILCWNKPPKILEKTDHNVQNSSKFKSPTFIHVVTSQASVSLKYFIKRVLCIADNGRSSFSHNTDQRWPMSALFTVPCSATV